jgi:predicted NUDIX family NTP pyrophosphohydrolase
MKPSAGILLFRSSKNGYQVLLAHPGGPFWAKKDKWSIPKGTVEEDEELILAAKREFQEEVGMVAPDQGMIELGLIKDGSKTNYIWASQGDFNPSTFSSNTFTMEWPPHSGLESEFPENDKADWFSLAMAKRKLFKGQVGFIDRLAKHLGLDTPEPEKSASSQLTLL